MDEKYKYLGLQQVGRIRLIFLSLLFLIRGYDVESFDDSVYGNFSDFHKKNKLFHQFLVQIRKVEWYAYFFEHDGYATIYIFFKPQKLWQSTND